MNNELLLGIVLGVSVLGVISFVVVRQCYAVMVPDGYAGVLSWDGEFVELLRSGWHIRWGSRYTLVAQDLRKATLTVPGRALLTSDGVHLRLSLVICYQVTDPVCVAYSSQNWPCVLCGSAQANLEEIVCRVPFEVLLNRRPCIEGRLLEALQPTANSLGIGVNEAELVFGWVEASPLRNSPVARTFAAHPG